VGEAADQKDSGIPQGDSGPGGHPAQAGGPVRARFELALEATRRPELRAAYDEMGLRFRAEAARLLAASGSAEPERDAWTLIAWLEGTAFYALAGAGTTAAPPLDVLRDQLTRLLAGLRGDHPDGA
jgi:hypothetical protein